jgi:Rrf2 family protein
MKISAKIDYACRALIELSLHWPNHAPLQIQIIAQNQKIPIKFLTQILIHLKQAGYVQSIRGKNGGYLLALTPQEIRLGDVLTHLDGISYSSAESRKDVNREHVMDAIWGELNEVVFNAMKKIDFEAICNRERGRDKSLMFQI